MKKLVLIPLIFIYSNTIHAQAKSGSAPNAKIVAGCLINSLGAVLIIQSVRIANNPAYDHVEGGKEGQRTKAIGVAALGGVCLLVGTLNIVKGVKQKKQQRLEIGTTSNGIGFIYKI